MVRAGLTLIAPRGLELSPRPDMEVVRVAWGVTDEGPAVAPDLPSPVVLGPAAPAALAYTLAALAARSPRLLLLGPLADGRAIGALAEHAVPFALGPAGNPLRPGVNGLRRLARHAGRVLGIGIEREALLAGGGLDEALGATSGDLCVAFADLLHRQLVAGRAVDLVRMAPPQAAWRAREEAGVAAGRLLRAARGRMPNPTLVLVGADLAAQAALPAALKRRGITVRRELTGHDLGGLATGWAGRLPAPRSPTLAELPAPIAAALRERAIVALRPDAAPRGARQLAYAAVDRDGLARLAVRLDHAPPARARERRAACEAWRRSGGWRADWMPELLAVATAGRTLVTVESLHRPVAAATTSVRFAEAVRWLRARRQHAVGRELAAATVPAGELTAAGRQLGGDQLATRLAGAVEALGRAPALPEHGGLHPDVVVVAPGRTVLQGWERFTEAGLPGVDALRLGIALLELEGGPGAVERALRAALHGGGGPALAPFAEEFAELGLGDHGCDLVLLALTALAQAEAEEERTIRPGLRTRRALLSRLAGALPGSAA